MSNAVAKAPLDNQAISRLRRQYEIYKQLDDVGDEDLSAFLNIYQRLKAAGVELPPHDVEAIEAFMRRCEPLAAADEAEHRDSWSAA